MTNWKRKIVDNFIRNYFTSAPKQGDNRSTLRVNTVSLFPDFDTAHPKETEAYIAAAKMLERKGIAKLSWENERKKERLKSIRCDNFKKLFREAGRPYPKAEVEKTIAMLDAKAEMLKQKLAGFENESAAAEQTKIVIGLLEFLSVNFGLKEIGHGITSQTMEDITRLFEFVCEPAQLENITNRALSILLYQDSKHLETLPSYYNHLLSRIQKTIPVPDLSFLERAYVETMISGKIIFEYKPSGEGQLDPPLINAKGNILHLPFESIETFSAIQLISGSHEKKVLTIENKESFYTLANPQKYNMQTNLSAYDCFLYTGGYPNRAAIALIKLLAASGFTFHHAGDLDPDGILILQHVSDIVREIAEKPVTPIKMDSAIFNQYRPWARQLTAPMLRHAEKIREDTKNIPGIAELLQRIEDTGMGIEQEMIDYR